MAIVAGFLLSAVQTWTGQKSLSGTKLCMLFSCWAGARIGLLLSSVIPIWVPALFDTLFLGTLSVVMFKLVYRVKQWHNIGFSLMLLVALLINAYSYKTLFEKDFVTSFRLWEGMLWWLALLITIVGGRVIPFFTAMRLKIDKPVPLPWIEKPTIALMVLLVLQILFRPMPEAALPYLFGVTGLMQLLRLSRWNGHRSLREPMLWSLHLAYLFIPTTLILMAIFYDNPLVSRQLLHLFAVGTLAGLCLSMMSRVSLGHTSRNVYQGPSMAPAFLALAVAALFRAILPITDPANTQLWHWLAGTFWVLGFLLFVWHYFPMLTQPRVDGRPG
ncbi:short-chain dehydrogenase [Paraferrimonas haliotis]|uniref:Short-chain dehydrogenase n=2 Tax=Paraferrimonas haliotis TaxID=2013866 RepID=A0AA37WXX1_9GAMM|nr:short-chain dehydrogenase [Paraferrimonas haliotis]